MRREVRSPNTAMISRAGAWLSPFDRLQDLPPQEAVSFMQQGTSRTERAQDPVQPSWNGTDDRQELRTRMQYLPLVQPPPLPSAIITHAQHAHQFGRQVIYRNSVYRGSVPPPPYDMALTESTTPAQPPVQHPMQPLRTAMVVRHDLNSQESSPASAAPESTPPDTVKPERDDQPWSPRQVNQLAERICSYLQRNMRLESERRGRR